jgi:hypothetical protein
MLGQVESFPASRREITIVAIAVDSALNHFEVYGSPAGRADAIRDCQERQCSPPWNRAAAQDHLQRAA